MKKVKYRLVYNRKKLLNSKGYALIQVEASLGKNKMYFGTRIYVRPEEWDQRKSCIVNHPNARDLNLWLYGFIIELEKLELSMWKKGITPTLAQIKDFFENKHKQECTFKEFCMATIENSHRKKSTQYNLLGTVRIINVFRPSHTWEDLTHAFLKDFEHWMRQKCYAINTIGKHLRNLRTLINEAIAAGHLAAEANPFNQYVIKREKSLHRFLKPEELTRMENIQLEGRLAHIRDSFLFCCYTGLRFSDFVRLESRHIIMQNGEPWLKMKTKKTGTEIQIPLFLIFGGKALKILNQYASIEYFAKVGKNSYVNQRLSELQQILHINTRITFHTARHTCATLLCHQGIPITTVQKILGHSNITTTQVYSEVMAETIVRDLSKGFGKANSREHH